MALPTSQQNEVSPATTPQIQESSTKAPPASDSKPKEKICCACPDTKKLRDECIVQHGEDVCSKWIEAHRMCLRSKGFKV